MANDVRLDHDGISELLKAPAMATMVRGVAVGVASAVTGTEGAEIAVDSFTTDRAAASVTIKDARGRLWQARNGVLTRAASSRGLEVTAR